MCRFFTAVLVLTVSLGFVFVAGCETKAQTGAGIGTLAGAGIGAIIGNQCGSTAVGALIGGAAGAGGGYLIGNEGDKKDARNNTTTQINSVRDEANTVVVNVTNSNGSITPVILRRSGNVYIGPKGEQYTTLPTEETLKGLYGI
jgi:outer membrane lipoprotein SlyB